MFRGMDSVPVPWYAVSEEGRPLLCGFIMESMISFFNVYNICLNSRRRLMLYLAYKSHLLLVLVSGDRDQLYRLGLTE
jgi:hypothetical protein